MVTPEDLVIAKLEWARMGESDRQLRDVRNILAVQGGTKTRRHLDAMLDALAGGGERPRLVHRLDKDTSGVLLLARNAASANHLTKAFRKGGVEKLYWALVVGVPRIKAGEIDLPLEKGKGPRGERMEASEDGRQAKTLYEVVEAAGKRMAWLTLRPLTGRTHQLRVHCAAMGNPILGDRKYGGAEAVIDGFDKKLHLHARAVRFRDRHGTTREITAPLPPHMAESWRFLGLDENRAAFDAAFEDMMP